MADKSNRENFKMVKFRFAIILLLALIGQINAADACTTLIISGKYTEDGKPILFKNRDTDLMENSLAWFNDGKYEYIGLVNSSDDWKKMVWGGYNSAGFAIMNSMAYNNNIGDTAKIKDQEGVIMKLALQNCKTIQDFEKLLTELPQPMGADANFGVIDAYGGAAYYETGNYRFVKYDVNDPSVAPNGYLIRTNHSFSGVMDEGLGFCRYNTAAKAMTIAAKKRQFNPQYLLNHISRNLTHSLTQTNLCDRMTKDRQTPDFRFFIDYIPRISTSAALLIVGAGNEAQIRSTVMWTILGFPLTSVAIPAWISGGEQLPQMVRMKKNLHAPICDVALKFKSECFPNTHDGGRNYINLSVLINKEKTGYMQVLKPFEDVIFRKANQLINELDRGTKSKSDIQDYYYWLDSYLQQSYKKAFNLELP